MAQLDVLVLARVDDTGWVEALTAHVADLPLQLIVRSHGTAEIDAIANELRNTGAVPSGAVTVWLTHSTDAVELHLHDASRGLLYRRTSQRAGSVFATNEVLAVITRRALASLATGELEGMELVKPPPVLLPLKPFKPPSPPPPPEPSGTLRVTAGYHGESLAPEVPWQNGGQFTAGWTWPVGLAIDVGYTLLPAIKLRNSVADLTLRRHPIELGLGYRKDWRRFAVLAQITANLDVLTSTVATAEPGVATTNTSAFEPGLGAHIRAVYLPTRWLGLFVSATATASPNAAPWVSRVGQQQVLLAPRLMRPAVSAGVEFRLQLHKKNTDRNRGRQPSI